MTRCCASSRVGDIGIGYRYTGKPSYMYERSPYAPGSGAATITWWPAARSRSARADTYVSVPPSESGKYQPQTWTIFTFAPRRTIHAAWRFRSAARETNGGSSDRQRVGGRDRPATRDVHDATSRQAARVQRRRACIERKGQRRLDGMHHFSA